MQNKINITVLSFSLLGTGLLAGQRGTLGFLPLIFLYMNPCFSYSLLFYPEDGSSSFIHNAGNIQLKYSHFQKGSNIGSYC
jgi:hypothetical protein